MDAKMYVVIVFWITAAVMMAFISLPWFMNEDNSNLVAKIGVAMLAVQWIATLIMLPLALDKMS